MLRLLAPLLLLLQLLLLPRSFAAAQQHQQHQHQQAAPAFQPPPAPAAARSRGVCLASSSGGNGPDMSSSPPPLRVLPKAVIFDLGGCVRPSIDSSPHAYRHTPIYAHCHLPSTSNQPLPNPTQTPPSGPPSSTKSPAGHSAAWRSPRATRRPPAGRRTRSTASWTGRATTSTSSRRRAAVRTYAARLVCLVFFSVSVGLLVCRPACLSALSGCVCLPTSAALTVPCPSDH